MCGKSHEPGKVFIPALPYIKTVMEKIDYVIGLLAFLLVASLLSFQPQDTAAIANPQAVGFMPSLNPSLGLTPDSMLKGYQSVAFIAAPEFVGDVITFNEGPMTISKIVMGFPIWLWIIIGGVIIINILYATNVIKFEIKDIEEPDTLMKIANPTTIVLMVVSIMYMTLLMTAGNYQYAVFYAILTTAPFGILTVLQQKFKKNFNFSVNDRILNWVDVVDKHR